MNNSNNFIPNIKRVISVDLMGSSQTLGPKDASRLKTLSDLHSLNRMRNHSLVDNLNKVDIRESLFKDLSSQSSEMDSLKQENYETHKINPLFRHDSQEDLIKTEDTSSINNIIKIDINNDKNEGKSVGIFEKNKIPVKEKKHIFPNEINKIIISNEKFPTEDILSLALSNDEPIYMDPNDFIRTGVASLSDKGSEFFDQETIVLDSISQKKFNSVASSNSSSSLEEPKIHSFKTSSTVFQLQIRKNSEILSQVIL